MSDLHRDRASEKWKIDRPTQTVFLGGVPRFVGEDDVRFGVVIFWLCVLLIFYCDMKQWCCLFIAEYTDHIFSCYFRIWNFHPSIHQFVCNTSELCQKWQSFSVTCIYQLVVREQNNLCQNVMQRF